MEDLKEKLMQIYLDGEQIVKEAYVSGDYESALGMISALTDYLYNINIIYHSDTLEDILKSCSENYLKFSLESGHVTEEKNILFFDEFGLDSRGLTAIYLKALANLGYHITYMTRYYRKGKLGKIEDIINGHGTIEYLERGTYKEEAENFIKIVLRDKCSKILLYTIPQGIVGPLTYYQTKKLGVTTYKINLTDHAFWIGTKAADYFIEFRKYGASISNFYRKIDLHKLVMVPFYPEIQKNVKFQGFPFEHKGKKVMFSGGTLYKTFGDDNKYYRLISDILKKHEDLVFWYAGEGDTSELKHLKGKYPKQVYYTKERKDLFQILEHCDIYIATYPISGGLMGQYAAMAGVMPMQLLHDEGERLLLKDASQLNCEMYDYKAFLDRVDYLLENDDYRKDISSRIRNQVISEQEFEDSISDILDKKRIKERKVEHVENINLQKYVELFIDYFPVERLPRILSTKRTVELGNRINELLSKNGIFEIRAKDKNIHMI